MNATACKLIKLVCIVPINGSSIVCTELAWFFGGNLIISWGKKLFLG